MLLNDYTGTDGRRRISGLVEVSPNVAAIAIWVETAPNSNQFDWYDLNAITINTGGAPHYVSTT